MTHTQLGEVRCFKETFRTNTESKPVCTGVTDLAKRAVTFISPSIVGRNNYTVQEYEDEEATVVS